MGSALPDIDEIDNAELLKFEKELLGFYITSHPLTDQQSAVERYTTASTKEAMLLGEGTEVTIGGMISRVKKVVTRNGRSAGMQMAIITLEDLDGQIDRHPLRRDLRGGDPAISRRGEERSDRVREGQGRQEARDAEFAGE